MKLTEQRGNAEGYCKTCHNPLGFDGQCSVCAVNALDVFIDSGDVYTTKSGGKIVLNTNSTSNLWNSTSAFFLRFLNRYPPIMDQLRVMHEEELEVVQAALTQPENLPSEVADLIVTAMGLMMCHGYTLDDLNDAMLRIAAKNDAKTLESHEVNSAGKIARKVKAE